jgi:DNA mismatch endonuclease, patch repair protein
MSRVRQKGTAPEVAVRALLRSASVRYRTHAKTLPGTPDIILQDARVVIFVHGCFWHGHNRCSRGALPRQNVEFWSNKIAKNKRRDRAVSRQLRQRGWTVVTVWECRIQKQNVLLARILRLAAQQKTLPNGRVGG